MSGSRYLLLGIGVAAISCAAVLVRIAQAPPLAIAASRLAIAAAILLPFGVTRARDELRDLVRAQWRWLLLAGVLLAIHFALWIASLSHTSVASSVVLVTSTPFFVALASWLFFRERLMRSTFVGVAVSLAGAFFIGYSGISRGGTAMSGNFLALGAALGMAGYLLVGRRLRRRAGLLAYSTAVFIVAAVVLLAAVAVSQTPLAGYDAKTYAAMLALALLPQLVGHVSLNWALKYLPATMVTVAVLGEPVGASLLAWATLGESPGPFELAGGALMLLGIGLAFLRGGAQRGAGPVPEL